MAFYSKIINASMRVIFLIPFMFVAFCATAQIDSIQKTKADSLYYKNLFFETHLRIMNNGKKVKKSEAQILFNKVPEAASLYKKYRNKYNVGLYSFIGAFTGPAISTLSFINGNRTLAAIGIQVTILSFANAVIFLSSGEVNLRKAIKAYNNHVLKY